MDLLSKVESFYSVNYGPSINMSNVSKMISVMKTYFFVVYRTKRELKCQNKLFLKYNFSGNISLYVYITEIILQMFDVLIDNP